MKPSNCFPFMNLHTAHPRTEAMSLTACVVVNPIASIHQFVILQWWHTADSKWQHRNDESQPCGLLSSRFSMLSPNKNRYSMCDIPYIEGDRNENNGGSTKIRQCKLINHFILIVKKKNRGHENENDVFYPSIL